MNVGHVVLWYVLHDKNEGKNDQRVLLNNFPLLQGIAGAPGAPGKPGNPGVGVGY